MKKKLFNPFRYAFIAAFCITFVTIFLSILPFVENLENRVLNGRFSFRGPRPHNEDVVLVTIDQDSFDDLPEQWPWPRGYYAKLIENLNRAGARLIVFDVEFTEPSFGRLEQDTLLYEAVTHYKNVLLAAKTHAFEGVLSAQSLLPPLPHLDLSIEYAGLIDIYNDDDGFNRRATHYQIFGDTRYLAIDLKALRFLYQQEGKDITFREDVHTIAIGQTIIPKFTRNSSLINFYGPPGTFPYYSLVSVLDDETFETNMEREMGFSLDLFNEYLRDQVFQNKIVFIGATLPELHDLMATPFLEFQGTKRFMPGVEIHANFMANLLDENFLQESPFWVNWLLIFVFAFVAVFSILITLHWLHFVGFVLWLIGYFAISQYAFGEYYFLLPMIVPTIGLVLGISVGVVKRYFDSLKEKKMVKTAFEHYVAPEVVNEMLKDAKNVQFGGQRRYISVLFSDIRSFTTFTESHEAEEVVDTLGEYLTEMVDVIIKNKGTVDKFVGDEIMALFGAPIPLENSAEAACRAALDMMERLRELQKKWKAEGKTVLDIGIGVNTGEAIVGNLGSKRVFDYTAIGDTVNLGARLEPLNKNFDCYNRTIISEFTLKDLDPDSVEVRYLASETVKGKTKAVKIYELIGFKQ